MFMFHSSKTEGPNLEVSRPFARPVYLLAGGNQKRLFKFRKRRNSLQKCFHLFKYTIDHENVRTFFLISLRTCSKSLNDVNSLHCLA